MSRSDLVEVAARVRDGVCVLGCTLRGVHFATCSDYGKGSSPVEWCNRFVILQGCGG